MTSGKRARANHMHIVLYGRARRFFWGLKEGSNVHVEAQIGERRGDHFLAAIVTVLAHLGDKDTRTAPFAF